MVKRLAGAVLRGGAPDRFRLLLLDRLPDLGMLELPTSSVLDCKRTGEHPIFGETYEVEVRVDAPLHVAAVAPTEPTIGGRGGVPFILATPHRTEAIRNPESMGGEIPVAPWER